MGDFTPYPEPIVRTIQIVYLIAIVCWILILYFLGVYCRLDLAGLFILSLPVIIFAIGYINAPLQCRQTETEMVKINFLPLALLFITLLVEWHRQRAQNKQVYLMIFLAFTFIILSVIDVWVSRRYLIITKHIRSILQTLSAVLLIYVLYLQFYEMYRA